MKDFYFLFNPNPNDFQTWVEGGFSRGFLTLFGLSLLTAIIYFLVLGNNNSKHSKIGRWLLFMFLNSLFIFLGSMAFINEIIPPEGINSIFGIAEDIWFFSLLNGTLYAIIIFFLFSILLNNFSLYSKYIPFNLIKRK